MKIRAILSAAVLLAFPPRVDADILYSVTDLGHGYQLQTNPDGSIDGVTDAQGTATYAYDKSPMTYVSNPTAEDFGNNHEFSYDFRTTITNGTTSMGYYYDYYTGGTYEHFFGPRFGGWELDAKVTPPIDYKTGLSIPITSSPPPISDFNVHNQEVGAMTYYEEPVGEQVAAFSRPGFVSHSKYQIAYGTETDPNNLNLYIPPLPGAYLTNAFKIDDQGRILASGSNGDTYLLTPVGLGAATPVPEPSTLLFYGVAAGLLAFRSARGRRAVGSSRPGAGRRPEE